MGLREVKAKLNLLKKDELIKLIGELYKKNKVVKEYLDYWLEPDEKALHMKFAEKIVEAFYPKQGYKVKLIDGKKAITDYKKFNPSPLLLADLMIVYVEVGTEYSAEVGDYESKNLTSIHSMLYDVLSYIQQNNLEEIFRERFEEFVDVSEQVGGFFHDITMQMLFDFIPEFLVEAEEEENTKKKAKGKAIILEFPKK